MKRTSAFTLIELLVVIAIIALLVSILMPSLQQAKDIAKNVICQTNQRNVCLGIMLYAEENDSMIPSTLRWPGVPYPHGASLTWASRIGIIPIDELPYEYRRPNPDPDAATHYWYEIAVNEGYLEYRAGSETEGTFKCPAYVDQVYPKSQWGGGYGRDFSINETVSGDFSTRDNESPNAACRKLDDIRVSCVLIGDGNMRPGGGIYIGYSFRTTPGYPGNGKLDELDIEKDTGFYSYGPWPFQQWVNVFSRTGPVDFYGHPGESANLTYTDGHVENVKNINPRDWMME